MSRASGDVTCNVSVTAAAAAAAAAAAQTDPIDRQPTEGLICLLGVVHTVRQRDGAHVACSSGRHPQRICCACAAAAVSDNDHVLTRRNYAAQRVNDLLVVAADARRVLVRVQNDNTPAPGVALLEKRQHAAPLQALLVVDAQGARPDARPNCAAALNKQQHCLF